MLVLTPTTDPPVHQRNHSNLGSTVANPSTDRPYHMSLEHKAYPQNLDHIYDINTSLNSSRVLIAKSEEMNLTKMVVEHWLGQPWRHGWPYNRRQATRSSPQPTSRWFPAVTKVIKHNRLSKSISTVVPESMSF